MLFRNLPVFCKSLEDNIQFFCIVFFIVFFY